MRRNALVAVAVAVVLVLGATATAGAAHMISGKRLKNNTVASTKIKDGTLGVQDLASDTQRRFTSINGYSVVTADSADVPSGTSGFARAVCPAGTRVTGGGAGWANGSPGTSTLSRNQPDAYSNGTSSAVTTATANAWFGQGNNTSGGPLVMRVYAFCASVY